MRVLYGVHGYGRGHATRTLAVLPHLVRKHQLLLLAGGDAHAAIAPEYRVVRIPTFGFAYSTRTGQRSNWRTLRRNLPGLLDLLLRGPVFETVCDVVREFAPDVVISDAEAWTHQVAAALRILRISFDHIGILAYCRPRIGPGDWLEACLDRSCYRLLMGRPDRVIVSSFYDVPPLRPGTRVVAALARPELNGLVPRRGEHLLVYFNKGHEQLNDRLLSALQDVGCPVRLYGSGRRGRQGRITFLPPSSLPFLEDLAACRAVISTAGNQLVGEALVLGKPLLVMPERCVEQRLNAAAVEHLGIGMRFTLGQLTAERVRAFLDRLDEYAANLRQHARAGLGEAVAALDCFLAELAPHAARRDEANETILAGNGAEIDTGRNRRGEDWT